MAKDFHSACERDFPAKEIATFLSQNLQDQEDIEKRLLMLHYVKFYNF